MTLLRIAGLVFIFIGLLITAATLIAAKRSGTFEAVKELGRIRSSGYIKEHREERGEDIYKRELATEHSRLMSRRAKRVLEKMEAEKASESKRAGVEKGTSLLEELPVKAGNKTPAAAGKKAADAVTLENAAEAEKTASLSSSEKTAVLGKGENTAVLALQVEDAYQSPDDGTAVLREGGTAILGGEGTAVLVNEGTAVLESREGTAVLREEGTEALDADTGTAGLESQGTAVLKDKGTALLVGKGTAILEEEN